MKIKFEDIPYTRQGATDEERQTKGDIEARPIGHINYLIETNSSPFMPLHLSCYEGWYFCFFMTNFSKLI